METQLSFFDNQISPPLSHIYDVLSAKRRLRTQFPLHYQIH